MTRYTCIRVVVVVARLACPWLPVLRAGAPHGALHAHRRTVRQHTRTVPDTRYPERAGGKHAVLEGEVFPQRGGNSPAPAANDHTRPGINYPPRNPFTVTQPADCCLLTADCCSRKLDRRPRDFCLFPILQDSKTDLGHYDRC